MIWLALVLVALAGYRAALAIIMDQVTEPLRSWTARRWPARQVPQVAGQRPKPGQLRAVVKLVNCPRCMSVWTCAAATVLAWSVLRPGPWPVALLVWPAAAGIDVPLIRWVP